MKRYLSLIIAISAIQNDLFAAEAGMPQLDPTYWASQAFWLILVFSILYISIAKFYLPKIKDNLDNRENKIKEDLETANKFNNLSETKLKEYEKIIENAKKEVIKVYLETKNKLDKDIKVIMLSLENAASGTNLTEATHLIFTDPIDGSREQIQTIENQAIGRACRIGQKNQVKIIKMITKDTIEEEIYNKTI